MFKFNDPYKTRNIYRLIYVVNYYVMYKLYYNFGKEFETLKKIDIWVLNTGKTNALPPCLW